MTDQLGRIQDLEDEVLRLRGENNQLRRAADDYRVRLSISLGVEPEADFTEMLSAVRELRNALRVAQRELAHGLGCHPS